MSDCSNIICWKEYPFSIELYTILASSTLLALQPAPSCLSFIHLINTEGQLDIHIQEEERGGGEGEREGRDDGEG